MVRDPGCLPEAAYAACDLLLTEDADADRPFTAPPSGLQAGLDAVVAALSANPVAATTLALLLRSTVAVSGAAALVAESASYSALQDGAEFQRWRAGRPARPPEPGLARIRPERSEADLRIVLARSARRNAIDWRTRDALAEALVTAVRDLPYAPVAADSGMAIADDQAADAVPRGRWSRQASGRPGQGATVVQP